jgi:hypothetical protein
MCLPAGGPAGGGLAGVGLALEERQMLQSKVWQGRGLLPAGTSARNRAQPEASAQLPAAVLCWPLTDPARPCCLPQADPTAWRLEVERVAPKLRILLNADAKVCGGGGGFEGLNL